MRRVMSGMGYGISSGITSELDENGLERATHTRGIGYTSRNNIHVYGLDKREHRGISAFWRDIY